MAGVFYSQALALGVGLINSNSSLFPSEAVFPFTESVRIPKGVSLRGSLLVI